AMADARFRSSEPRSRLTSAAARLISPRACTISLGMHSVPMRKLCSERCVWAPHSLFAGIFNSPNASLSTRVFEDRLPALGISLGPSYGRTAETMPNIGRHKSGHRLRQVTLFFPEAV